MAVGEVVAKDALLGEVETDKVTLEIESPAAGRITQILVNPGDTIPVGEPIIILETEVAAPVAAAPAPPEAAPAPVSVVAAVAPVASSVAAPAPSANGHSHDNGSNGTAKIPSTPLARRMAATHGIDLAAIAQPGMPVRSAAVLAFVAAHAPATLAVTLSAPLVEAAVPVPDGASTTQVPLTSMRRIIAERTTASFTTTPHIYLDTEVDMWRIEQWRAGAKVKGQAVSATVLLMRAVALALRQHPDVNAGFVAAQGNMPAHIQRWGAVNLAIAVAVPGGLVAPVLRDADTRPLAELAQELDRIAQSARNGKLGPDDLVGGTFSISNLGMYGIDTFHAIITAPQAAILAVGRITRRPVVITDAAQGESIAIRPILKLSLSADHRVVDGATGAQFLATLRTLLEDPSAVIAERDTAVAHKGA